MSSRNEPTVWKKGFRAGLLAACALLLSGCNPDVYEETCVWHSDLNIKGCDFYGFKECVHHCTYCVRENGPDECGQLKCAAYCAQRNGDDDCRSNFKTLCGIALQEQTDLSGCDVDCSFAGRRAPRFMGLFLALSLAHLAFSDCSLQLVGNAKRLALLCALAAIGVTLHGCCEDPEHQLDWDPDYEEFKSKADWYDENGIWRGNPTWKFSPEHEAEEYVCKAMHESRPICVVWTTKEWNCNEQDFGLCKCHTLPSDGEYCQAWGCHSLEADQELCSVGGDNKNEVSCSYEEFVMDANKYSQLVSMQETGSLTTGESSWWNFGSVFLTGNNRLLSEDSNASAGPLPVSATGSMEMLRVAKADSEDPYNVLRPPLSETNSSPDAADQFAPVRMLQNDAWPPSAAYNPALRWKHFSWNEVCIANGDNIALVKKRCNKWREIETEISQCVCKVGSPLACMEWSCEERDVGLFSVLFRTAQPIAGYTEGTEMEKYKCKAFADGAGSRCVAWEGDISSLEEVEWTRCECSDGQSCHGVGAAWKCDEYELPRTRDFLWHENRAKWTYFLVPELLALLAICKAGMETSNAEDAAPVGCCMSTCVGILVFPFLMVTLGCPGFLFLGLPFWSIRACFGCFVFCKSTGTVVRVTSIAEDSGVTRSTSDRFKRGTSAILGRRQIHNELT